MFLTMLALRTGISGGHTLIPRLICFARGDLIELSKAIGWSQHTTFDRFYLRLLDSPLLADAVDRPVTQKQQTAEVPNLAC
nr:hypothetical protein BaRGS_003342 [Batillaria attramentaria]